MNEQLRKAIEEATKVYPCGYNVDLHDHTIAQAKLLRVIEMLVQQRDVELDDNCWTDDRGNGRPFEWAKQQYDAELIAALEGKP